MLQNTGYQNLSMKFNNNLVNTFKNLKKSPLKIILMENEMKATAHWKNVTNIKHIRSKQKIKNYIQYKSWTIGSLLQGKNSQLHNL